MLIRPANVKDIESIRILNTSIMEKVNQACDTDLVPYFAQTEAGKHYFIEALERKDGCFFVAEDNNALVGYVNGGTKEVLYRKSKYFEIENLGVSPDYKRSGIGTQLLETITNWAKDHGYQKIYLESYIKNSQAIAFYKKHGYQEIDISLEKNI